MPDNHNVSIIGPVQINGKNGYSLNLIPSVAETVTPSASGVFPAGLLFVGVGGDILARPADQNGYKLFKNVPSGTFLPIYVIAVSNDASTTATNLLVCY